MKISIAMATYNGEKYIEEQLQSFVDQTLQPDEVIVTDDNSTDNTVEIIREFAKKAPFKIEVSINEKNLGYAGNFSAALMKTTGDLVFLSDQDDVWFAEKISHMVHLATSKPKYLIYMNDAELTDGKLNSVNLTKCGQIKSAGLNDNSFVMGCCCAVRRELLDFTLPIPQKFKAHDNWLVEIADGLEKKYIDLKVLQYYRRHENNESQFIANRLTPVNKMDRYLAFIKSIVKSDKKNTLNILIEQMEVFIEGLEKASVRVDIKYKDKYNKFLIDKKEQLKLYKQRRDIRNSNFFKRLSKAISMYQNGYPKQTRLKNMIRDIIGKI